MFFTKLWPLFASGCLHSDLLFISISLLIYTLKRQKVKTDIALHGNPISELRDVTCHMGSHSVTCHPTQVNAPRLYPNHAGWYSIYLLRRDGRLSWPTWLDSAPAESRTSDLPITRPTPNRCTTMTTNLNCFSCSVGCHVLDLYRVGLLKNNQPYSILT